jgi:hypothetical protein
MGAAGPETVAVVEVIPTRSAAVVPRSWQVISARKSAETTSLYLFDI